MRTIREPAREIPVVRDVDVLVVGGGPAGFIAAAAAARLGVSTLLVERYGCLGGLATGGLVLYMDGIADKQGVRVIGGLPWEAMERLQGMSGLASDGPLRLHVDSELLKVVADELCIASGAELRLHSWAVGVLREGSRVTGAIVESKSGRQAILAKVCIDATGDGDLAAMAGAPYEMGNQRIGLNLKIGGIDRERYRAFVNEQPERARELRAQLRALGGFPFSPNSTPDSDAGVYWINILGLAGRDRLGRDEGTVHEIFDGELSAINVEDLTYVEVELRRRLIQSLDFHRKHVPGFENARLLAFASQLGVRESRRILGRAMLTQQDVVNGRSFEDTIGLGGIGFAAVGRYEVPYGCLVPKDVDGLLVAGRCISVDHWTQQAIRLIPPAMMTGQAVGTAAAMAAKANVSPDELDTDKLRQQLAKDGVILE